HVRIALCCTFQRIEQLLPHSLPLFAKGHTRTGTWRPERPIRRLHITQSNIAGIGAGQACARHAAGVSGSKRKKGGLSWPPFSCAAGVRTNGTASYAPITP